MWNAVASNNFESSTLRWPHCAGGEHDALLLLFKPHSPGLLIHYARAVLTFSRSNIVCGLIRRIEHFDL